MSAQLSKDKVLNDNGVLITNDIIYLSSNISGDYNLIKDKVVEFYYKKNITILVSAYLNKATVLLIDKDTIQYDLHDPEINYAITHNIRIITFTKFSEAIHSDLVLIDNQMYGNLIKMIKSKDQDTLTLACEIMSNSNRTDPVSINNLIKLSCEFDVSLFSGISKQDLKMKSPHISELFNFLEKEHYEEYQKCKTGD
jgi:hypothetical protein